MDFPLFASLTEIVWTFLTFWLIWFGVGLVVSLWIIRRAIRGHPERAEDAHDSIAHHLDRRSA